MMLNAPSNESRVLAAERRFPRVRERFRVRRLRRASFARTAHFSKVRSHNATPSWLERRADCGLPIKFIPAPILEVLPFARDRAGTLPLTQLSTDQESRRARSWATCELEGYATLPNCLSPILMDCGHAARPVRISGSSSNGLLTRGWSVKQNVGPLPRFEQTSIYPRAGTLIRRPTQRRHAAQSRLPEVDVLDDYDDRVSDYDSQFSLFESFDCA